MTSKTPEPSIQRSRSSATLRPEPPRQRRCNVHCNGLWSLWYGLLTLGLQSYIVYKCVTRFLTYISLPWPSEQQPYLELNLYVGLVGAGVVLLPFFFISFMFKIGNLANDGYKLGYNLSTCSLDPPSVLARSSGLVRNAWHHGGPTSPFIHLVSSFCFLLPRVIIEAKLIEVGFLSRDSIWESDLAWMVPNNDRLIVLSFFTGGTSHLQAEVTTSSPVSHPAEQIRKFLESDASWHPCSAEYINYALALLVFAVRYPAVFWKTNKAISFLFSLQLIGNGLQNLMAFSAMSVMYKVHVIGPQNVLHKYEPFLLNTSISMLLYLLSCVIVTASSSVIYMYGYQKFMAFIQQEREKQTIQLAEGKTSVWQYFPHTAAMCTLIALAVCNGPLLYDFTIIYKGSLDGTVLVFVIATVLHLFLWIVTWLFLTVKMTWKFKLRVTVGRAAVHNAKSIKLVNDIDLHHAPVDKENAPMLIVGFGKTFTVHDQAPKKLIMRTLARAAMETDKALEEEDMYWLKGEAGPQAPNKMGTLSNSTMMRVHASPSLNKRAEGQGQGAEGGRGQGGIGDSGSPRRGGGGGGVGGQRSPANSATVQDTDDRIPKETLYGTIRPKKQPVADDDVDCLPPPPQCGGEYEDARPLLAPPRHQGQRKEGEDHTPRSNRSIDSGLPDSSSTTSSTSPPGQNCTVDTAAHRKSSSLDNINLPGEIPVRPGWKSYSLQRGAVPPTEEEASRLAAETLVINRLNSHNNHQQATPSLPEEDPYGRITNMRLTTFTEPQLGGAPPGPRDPRIIDLAQGSAGQLQQPVGPPTTQYSTHTLPAHPMAGSGQLPHHPHNTLPARVGESPPRNNPAYPQHHPNLQPTGRHFKPFDHRKMNPMAEIQENPYEQQAATMDQYQQNGHNGLENNGHEMNGGYQPLSNGDTTYVVHHNTHIPHMPTELRHTNYGAKPQLVHPQVLQHRDSANYSLASSDSG